MGALVFEEDAMKRMMQWALDFGASKSGHRTSEQLLDALSQADCQACAYLRYGLATQMAEYLGSMDGTVKAVYVYEPEYALPADGAAMGAASPGVHMIAWVDRKSAALKSVVEMLGAGLAHESKSLPCPKADAQCYDLSIQLVDDDEVLGRTGLGAVLTSIYVRPIEVWRRKADRKS